MALVSPWVPSPRSVKLNLSLFCSPTGSKGLENCIHWWRRWSGHTSVGTHAEIRTHHGEEAEAKWQVAAHWWETDCRPGVEWWFRWGQEPCSFPARWHVNALMSSTLWIPALPLPSHVTFVRFLLCASFLVSPNRIKGYYPWKGFCTMFGGGWQQFLVVFEI